jgi:hypothetical protein
VYSIAVLRAIGVYCPFIYPYSSTFTFLGDRTCLKQLELQHGVWCVACDGIAQQCTPVEGRLWPQ